MRTENELKKLRDYCGEMEYCDNCIMSEQCKKIDSLILPSEWTDEDIAKILQHTRNYMEQTFIKSLKKIIERQGRCIGVKCNDCPFWHTDTNIDHKKNYCAGTSLYKVKNIRITERKEIAEWLLEIYKGEKA